MITMTLGEVAAAVAGTLGGGANPKTEVTGPVVFDSRAVTPGLLFLALAGERVDGHDYAAGALADGAVAVLATRPVDGPHVLVADGLAALGSLARESLRRLPDVRVIGVTGSSGKTSTKDLLASLLERLGPTIAPPGSFNNELGHPYTVLLADESTRFLVLEKSARGIGHIEYLTTIAPPQVGAVLNVGTAHLGEFGSVAAIEAAKGELVAALPSAADGGVAVLNIDDPAVARMAARTSARIVGVGESPAADVRAENISLDDLGRASFTLHAAGSSVDVTLAVSGEHHVSNALAAAAVALECGMHLDELPAALAAAGARSGGRMAITERGDGLLIIDDSYNANPDSMRAALKALASIARRRRGTHEHARSWAVLGPMAELGPAGPGEHDALGRLAVRLDIGTVVAVGDAARPIAQGAALEGSWNGESRWVGDIDAALGLLEAELAPGDVVLVKASRSAGLERLVKSLLEREVSAR